MAFSPISDALNQSAGATQSAGELAEFQRLTAELRRVLTEESGFQTVDKTISLDEALKRATPTQQRTFDILDKTVNELKEGIRIGEELGLAENQVHPTARGTTLGFSLGHGPGTFTMADLRRQLVDITKERENIVGNLTNVQTFEKTPERLEQEKQLESLREKQFSLLNTQIEQQQREFERLEDLSQKQLERFGKLEELQAGQPEDLAERKRSFSADTGALEKQLNDSFIQFKESEARAGRTILGDNPFTATAKGTAAQQSLERFQNVATQELEREQERQFNQQLGLQGAFGQLAGIQQTGAFGQAGLFQSGVGQVPTLGPGFAGALPPGPSLTGFSAINQSLLPLQFQQQLNLQQQALIDARRQASKDRSAGLLGAGIGAVGAITGGFLGGLGG